MCCVLIVLTLCTAHCVPHSLCSVLTLLTAHCAVYSLCAPLTVLTVLTVYTHAHHCPPRPRKRNNIRLSSTVSDRISGLRRSQTFSEGEILSPPLRNSAPPSTGMSAAESSALCIACTMCNVQCVPCAVHCVWHVLSAGHCVWHVLSGALCAGLIKAADIEPRPEDMARVTTVRQVSADSKVSCCESIWTSKRAPRRVGVSREWEAVRQ